MRGLSLATMPPDTFLLCAAHLFMALLWWELTLTGLAQRLRTNLVLLFKFINMSCG